MNGYVAQIPEWFSTRKAAQVLAYLLSKSGGQMNILKATKLIYLAERRSMERRECTIVDDHYVSMPFGPVNSYTYSYMDGKALARIEEWRELIAPRDGNQIRWTRPVSPDELSELSRAELKILDSVWDEFQDIDRFDLADWTHRYCPEWRDPNGSSMPIELASIYKALHKDSPVELAEQMQAERRLRIQLARIK